MVRTVGETTSYWGMLEINTLDPPAHEGNMIPEDESLNLLPSMIGVTSLEEPKAQHKAIRELGTINEVSPCPARFSPTHFVTDRARGGPLAQPHMPKWPNPAAWSLRLSNSLRLR
jgi:hypothetical protein